MAKTQIYSTYYKVAMAKTQISSIYYRIAMAKTQISSIYYTIIDVNEVDIRIDLPEK